MAPHGLGALDALSASIRLPGSQPGSFFHLKNSITFSHERFRFAAGGRGDVDRDARNNSSASTLIRQRGLRCPKPTLMARSRPRAISPHTASVESFSCLAASAVVRSAVTPAPPFATAGQRRVLLSRRATAPVAPDARSQFGRCVRGYAPDRVGGRLRPDQMVGVSRPCGNSSADAWTYLRTTYGLAPS
jgi:hypothetical protein